MKDLERTVLLEEWIQNIDADAFEKNPHKYEKLTSMKKKIDRNYKTGCWPKSIMESLNWLPFLDIMEFTDKYIFPSLLKTNCNI